MEQLFLWDMFDQAIAEQLEVDIQTYVDTIDLFDDKDMEYIITTILSTELPEEEKQKAKDLFNTKVIK